MTKPSAFSIQFDDVRVEPRAFKAFKADAAVALEPKTFELLLYLIENRDRLVDKRELLDAVWKDVAVTENSLTREIGKLRRVLGDDPKTPKYIETVHTRGYRFIADIRRLDETPQESPQNSAAGGAASTGAELSGFQAPRHISKWLPYKLFVGLSAIGLLAASAFLLRKPDEGTKKPAPDGRVTTLAVLPFRSLSADEPDRYIGLGIADALITKLANSVQLSIEPLSTVLHYAAANQDSLAIGHAMHVDYVLEGKFQKSDGRLRVTVQLLCITCAANAHWAASFDETSSDLFQVQDSISQKVAAALPLELTGEEQKRLAKRETSDSDAQLAFIKGRSFQNEDTHESLEKSIEYFQMAASKDPSYAAPWVLLADSYRRRQYYGAAPADFLPLAREAAEHALKLDDTIPYAHSMRGLIAFEFDWDFADAAREYARARALQPSWMHQWYFRYLLATNHASEAESEYVRFNQRVPFSAFGNTNFGEFLFLTRQYNRAAQQAKQTIEMRPDYAPAHDLLGEVYEQQGLSEQARQEFQKAIELSHGYSGLASLGHLYAASGKHAELESVLQELQKQRKQRYIAPFELAVIHAGMGEKAKALADLQRAYQERSLSAQSLRFDARLDDVRREPAYHEFAKRLGVD